MADDGPSGLKRVAEVFIVALILGCTAFGGPVAHLGYFRETYVRQRKWLSDEAYGELVALCQFLPGPASSQAGFAIGLHRAGLAGGIAAFVGFTLPSALIMLALAWGVRFLEGDIASGVISGLKVAAVAVVAHAVLGMARTLTPDWTRLIIALLAGAAVLFVGTALIQPAVIAVGALIGLVLCRDGPRPSGAPLAGEISRPLGAAMLVLFALLLIGLPLLVTQADSVGLARFEAFYRSGALVFGGGHVVLPLLNETVVQPGWISSEDFLAGYGAAQALPGPLFAISAYLGAGLDGPPNGVPGGLMALAALFLPGLLLVLGVLPFWSALRKVGAVHAGMRGANAAVVGLLAAALYNPVWVSAIVSPGAVLVAVIAFALLWFLKTPPLLVVGLCAAAGPLIV